MDQPTPTAAPSSTYVTRSAHFPPDVEQVTHGSIRLNPTDKLYENLEADERAVLYLGRHRSRLLRPLGITVLFALVPPVFFSLLFVVSFTPPVLRYAIVLTWFWYTFLFYYVLATLIAWRSDVYIISNERIIDFDANAFFFRKVTDTDLESIHEVHYEAGGGLIGGSIDRGDVIVTDVSGSQVVMRNIPRPRDIALVIGELVEEAKQHAAATAASGHARLP